MIKQYMAVLCLGACLFSLKANAQNMRAFYIGYGGGTYLDGLRNLEIEARRYNLTPGRTVTQPLTISPWFSGITVGYNIDIPDTKIGFDLNWTNRHNETTAIVVAQGVESTLNMKYRVNSFAFGMYYTLSKGARIGIAPDIGDFTIQQRAAPTPDISKTDYTNFYDESSTLATGFSAFAILQTKVSKKVSLSLRPYLRIDEFETTMTANLAAVNYVFRLSSFGVNVAISFGNHSSGDNENDD